MLDAERPSHRAQAIDIPLNGKSAFGLFSNCKMDLARGPI
jgi:hypothetical protein